MNNSPCWNNGKGCAKRRTHPTNCHSNCKEYKEWVAERAKGQIANASQKAYLGYYYNIINKNRSNKK